MDGSDQERLVLAWKAQGPKLWRALVASTGDRAVAEDALSEAFAQALARGSDLREPDRWLWRAAFRIAAAEMKERRRVVNVLDHEPPVEDPEALGLLSTLQRLTERQRAALVLHYYVGYRTREIAEILGTNPTTVRVHLSVGRSRLRRLLEEEDD